MVARQAYHAEQVRHRMDRPELFARVRHSKGGIAFLVHCDCALPSLMSRPRLGPIVYCKQDPERSLTLVRTPFGDA